MSTRRLLLSLSVLGFLYAPTVSAKYAVDVTPPQRYQPAVLSDSTEMTRAAFVAAVVNKLYIPADIDSCFWDISSTVPPSFSLLYTDVRTSHMYAKELCIAMRDGIARGYKDGNFRPEQKITFAEASKILARAYVLAPYAELTLRKEGWYAPYAIEIAGKNAIPLSVTTFDHIMTAGETADIIERLSDGVSWRPSRSYEDVRRATFPETVSVQKIETTTATATTPRRPINPATSSAASSAMEQQSSSAKSQEPWYKIF